MSTSVSEAKQIMQELFPAHVHGNQQSAIYEAYDALKTRYATRYEEIKDWTLRRVETLFRGTARRVDGFELDVLRAEKSRKLIHDEITRNEEYVTYLLEDDPELHRSTIDRLQRITQSLRDEIDKLDSPLA